MKKKKEKIRQNFLFIYGMESDNSNSFYFKSTFFKIYENILIIKLIQIKIEI